MAELFALPELATKLDAGDLDGGMAAVAHDTAAALIVAELGGPLPTPVPRELAVIGLQVAARVYAHPQGATPDTPDQVGRASAYLGRDERAVVQHFRQVARGLAGGPGPIGFFPPPPVPGLYL